MLTRLSYDRFYLVRAWTRIIVVVPLASLFREVEGFWSADNFFNSVWSRSGNFLFILREFFLFSHPMFRRLLPSHLCFTKLIFIFWTVWYWIWRLKNFLCRFPACNWISVPSIMIVYVIAPWPSLYIFLKIKLSSLSFAEAENSMKNYITEGYFLLTDSI